jgi:hypothetical protein
MFRFSTSMLKREKTFQTIQAEVSRSLAPREQKTKGSSTNAKEGRQGPAALHQEDLPVSERHFARQIFRFNLVKARTVKVEERALPPIYPPGK